MSDDNVIRVDFDGRTSESQYYELQTDIPDHPSVYVSVTEEGLELVQSEDGEMHIVHLTDGQLQAALMVFAAEVMNDTDEEEVTYQ